MKGSNDGSGSGGDSGSKGETGSKDKSASKGESGSSSGSCGSQTLRVEGTNVVRVPFGVRHARRVRPQRPDHWATLVLSFQGHNDPTPPPQAA